MSTTVEGHELHSLKKVPYETVSWDEITQSPAFQTAAKGLTPEQIEEAKVAYEQLQTGVKDNAIVNPWFPMLFTVLGTIPPRP